MFISKNPYAWLLSISKKPYHMGVPFNRPLDQFITQQLNTVGRENTERGKWPNAMVLYSEKYRGWLSLPPPVTHIRYRELVDDPRAILNQILNDDIPSNHVQVNMKTQLRPLTDAVLKKTGKKQAPLQDYVDKYTKMGWKKLYVPYKGKSILKLINEHLDRDVVPS